MTSLPKNFAVAVALTSLVLACGGRADDGASTGSPSAGAPAASSDEKTAEELPRAPFCEQKSKVGPGGLYFETLTPSQSPEYFAVRHNAGSIPGGLTEELVTTAERGVLCGGASDVEKCKAAYEKLNPEIRADAHYCFTRGDTVGCLEKKSDAMAFLGEIDSIEEAFFIAQYDLYWAQCTYPQTIARGEKRADGSFRLVAQDGGGCSDVIYRATIDVTKDGTVTEIASEKTDLSYGCP